jgi:hypothetical protein
MKEIVKQILYGINPNLTLVKSDDGCGKRYAVYTTKYNVPDEQLTQFMSLSKLYGFICGVLNSKSFMEKANQLK